MPPGKPVGLLVDLKDTRPITISSTSDSSSSGHPVARSGAFKKRKIEVTLDAEPGTTITLAQLKVWDEARKVKERNQMPRKGRGKGGAGNTTVKKWTERKGPMIVEYMRAPQRPPTKVETWLLLGFEEGWKEEQEAAWAEDPQPAQKWGTIEEWARAVCDALELWG